MSIVVSLREVVNEMAEMDDAHSAFLDLRTGDVFTLNEAQRQLLEHGIEEELSEAHRELREALRSGDVLELPNAYEQKQYTIVERYCHSVRDPDHRARLLKAIRGRQAFRDFKRELHELNITENWIGFRNRAFEGLAIDWLERNGVAFDRAA